MTGSEAGAGVAAVVGWGVGLSPKDRPRLLLLMSVLQLRGVRWERNLLTAGSVMAGTQKRAWRRPTRVSVFERVMTLVEGSIDTHEC